VRNEPGVNPRRDNQQPERREDLESLSGRRLIIQPVSHLSPATIFDGHFHLQWTALKMRRHNT
jgi:hypothetical protein